MLFVPFSLLHRIWPLQHRVVREECIVRFSVLTREGLQSLLPCLEKQPLPSLAELGPWRMVLPRFLLPLLVVGEGPVQLELQ